MFEIIEAINGLKDHHVTEDFVSRVTEINSPYKTQKGDKGIGIGWNISEKSLLGFQRTVYGVQSKLKITLNIVMNEGREAFERYFSEHPNAIHDLRKTVLFCYNNEDKKRLELIFVISGN